MPTQQTLVTVPAKTDLKQYAQGFHNQPALLWPGCSNIGQMLVAASMEVANAKAAHESTVRSVYGVTDFRDDKPFTFANGIAFIPVQGLLMNRFNWISSYACGYGALRAMLFMALDDDDVKGIVLDNNSHGGMVQGCFELAEDIFKARSVKPIMTMVDANSHSAGYALGSASSRMIVTPSASVGSVGVVITHVDYSKMLDEAGITVTFVFSGDHKVDGNAYEPLPKAVKAQWQKEVSKLRGQFAQVVANHRGISVEAVMATEANVYDAEEAMALNLVDEIAKPSDAIQSFMSELSGSTKLGGKTMATQNVTEPAATQTPTQPAAAAPAPAPVAQGPSAADERARIAGILGCAEAKDRGKLANHIALSTDMSLEAARGILAASAVETVAAAPAANNSADSAFVAAMNAAQHPEIKPESQQAQGQSPAEGSAEAILANYNAASGASYKLN